MRLTLALAFGFACTTQAATITTIPSQTAVSVGNSVRVDVSVSDVANLYAFQFDLNYTPGVFSAQTVIETGYFSSNGISFSPGTVNNNSGRITFIADSLSGSSAGFTGTTLLASVIFAAQGGGTTQIAPADVILLNSSLVEVSALAVGSSVAVTGTAVAPEPNSFVLLFLGFAFVRLLRKPIDHWKRIAHFRN